MTRIIEGVYTVDDVAELRDRTAIGSYIEFNKVIYKEDRVYDPKKDGRRVRIKGIVTEKYPNIFMLSREDGSEETYSWVDYLLGR